MLIDFERIQVPITRVQGGRNVPTKQVAYDYKVMINGYHRATFRTGAKWSHKGFALEACGAHVRLRKTCFDTYYGIQRSDFVEVTKLALERNEIPTPEEIKRWETIEQAEKDNVEWHQERERYRHDIYNEMLTEALQGYLTNWAMDQEEVASDKRLRDKITAAHKALERIR